MKEVVIYAKHPELVYDIENITHQIARHRTQMSVEDQFVMQTSDTETDTAFIKRSLDRAYNKVRKAVSSVLTEGSWGYGDDDLKLAEKDGYYLYATVRDTFNQANTEAAAMAFHDFLVNSSVFDWLLISKPDEAAIYKQLMEDNLSDLKTLLTDRTGFYTIDPFPKFQERNYNR